MKVGVTGVKKSGNLKVYFTWIILTEAVGALAGWLIRDGVKTYNMTVIKPPFSPPSIAFPIVWGVLYAIMGFGVARVYTANDSIMRTRSLLLFVVQLAFNFFWSIIFFNMQSFGTALFWLLVLWILIVLMISLFCRVDKTAGLMQVPYLLWVTFAAYLNYGVWRLN